MRRTTQALNFPTAILDNERQKHELDLAFNPCHAIFMPHPSLPTYVGGQALFKENYRTVVLLVDILNVSKDNKYFRLNLKYVSKDTQETLF